MRSSNRKLPLAKRNTLLNNISARSPPMLHSSMISKIDLFNSKLQMSFLNFFIKISESFSPKTLNNKKIIEIISNTFFRPPEQTNTQKKHRIVIIKLRQEIAPKIKIVTKLNQDKRGNLNL